MLIFYRLFLKPFYKTKKKFSLYFILIFILTLSFGIIFSFRSLNKSNVEQLNSSIDIRKIETINLSNKFDISYLKKINHVSFCYPIYEEVKFAYSFADLSTIQNRQFDYEPYLTMGRGANEDNYEIVLPNYIFLNGEEIDLSIYYDTMLEFHYYTVEKDYSFQAKVVGIYDNYDNSSYVIATDSIFQEIDFSLSVQKYVLIIDDISNMDVVLKKLNDVSNSYIIASGDYENAMKIVFLNHILNFIILFVGIMLLIVFFFLIRNLIYDLRSDIFILSAYGYSLFCILKNIFFIILFLFVISYILSNILFLVFRILFSKYIEIGSIGFLGQFSILLIGIIINILSVAISLKKYHKQSISAFLKL